MDIDIGIVIAVIALATSILGTLLNIIYTRRRTKATQEQVSISKREAERKRACEEASKAIRQAISMIKQKADIDYFHFSPLHFSMDSILAHMHDDKLTELTLYIEPESIDIFDEEYKRVDVRTVDDLIETLGSCLDLKPKCSGGTFNFTCTPSILENTFVELGEAFDAIQDFYEAYGLLNSHRDIIEVFDSKILDDLKKSIDDMLAVIFNTLMSKHEIKFNSKDKSSDILRKLENEIVGLESIKRRLSELSFEICDHRLDAIQKEIFLKS